MIETMCDYSRLEVFLHKCREDIHSEMYDNKQFIDSGIDEIKEFIKFNDKVLDVGCGHGYALEKFKELGAVPTGITLNEDDHNKTRFMGHDIRIMDMNFLEFEDQEFDIVWARHCLEHTIMPYFVLTEMSRIIKKGGIIYIEVPSPDTCGANEEDPNHYSVFGGKMWWVLINKAGFDVILKHTLQFPNNRRDGGNGLGTDEYLRFVGRKN